MRERDIERKLVEEVKKAGGMCLKLVSPGNAGVPDRLVLYPGGRVTFVELKAPGKKPRLLQIKQMEKIRKMGFKVLVVDGMDGIKEVMPGEVHSS